MKKALCIVLLLFAGCSGDSADTITTTTVNEFSCIVEINGHVYGATVKQQVTPAEPVTELTPLSEEGDVIEEGDINYEPGPLEVAGDICSGNRVGSSEETETDVVTTTTTISATGVQQ